MKIFIVILAMVGFLFIGCRQAYNPPAIASPGSYLVVEGVINNGSDSTIINLSYTVNVASNTKRNAVLNATVAVESDQNINYPLTETNNGKYFTTNLNLDNTHKYRLTITTSDNKQYYSDYEPVLNSPPIDSLYFTTADNQLNINSTAHDPTNNIQYYRWDYKQTWIIHSAYYSYFKSDGFTIFPRDLVNDNIYECWSTDTSSTVVLKSTSNLEQSIVRDNIITSFPLNSEKVAIRFSIMVSQYALTAEAFKFWTNLKKNTEKLGGIFDPQPSEINGNIHCLTNPNEPVIGYLSVGQVANKRIFISNRQLPQVVPNLSTATCELDTFWFCRPGTSPPNCENMVDEYITYNKYNLGVIIIPIVKVGDIGYLGTSPFCADCTLRGTNRKPDFWK